MRRHSRRLAIAIGVILLAGCVREPLEVPSPQDEPVASPAKPGTEVAFWEEALGQQEELPDLSEPFARIESGRLYINLPFVMDYQVTQVCLEEGVLWVETDLPDGTGEGNLLAFPGSVENLKVIRLEPAPQDVLGARILGLGGKEINLGTTLAGVIDAINEYAGAQFGLPPFARLFFQAHQGVPVLCYYIDLADAQVINDKGTAAVSGAFLVDAGSGNILEASLHERTLRNTRYLFKGGIALGWLDSETVIAAFRDPGWRLDGVEIQGSIKFSHPLPFLKDTEEPNLVALAGGSTAYFAVDDGYYALDLMSGGFSFLESLHGGTEAVQSAPPLSVQEEAIGDEGRRVVTVIPGGSDQTFMIPVDSLGDYSELRRGAWSDPAGPLFFTTEIEGPRYGVWVTEYKMWQMEPLGEPREVCLLPVPFFSLAPDGRHALYTYGNNCSIVQLHEVCPDS